MATKSSNPKMNFDAETARYFRDQFRAARAIALQDSEGFQEILFSLERFGAYLTGRMQTLKSYKTNICKVANRSALAEYVPTQHRSYHLGFARLYKLVNDARNDALHQGAFARHLTNNATQLALVLEDALMNNSTSAADYMVREPVTASFWQPLSFIRQQMLANSFTYLPVFSTKGPPCWKLVSDYHIAVYLRTHNRKDRLAKTLEDAANEHLTLESAKTCNPDMPINKVLEISEGKPVLVVDQQNPDRLLGIITPFDLL